MLVILGQVRAQRVRGPHRTAEAHGDHGEEHERPCEGVQATGAPAGTPQGDDDETEHKACAADEQHRAAGRPKQCAERAVAGGTADQGHHRHTRNEEPEEQQHHRRPCRLTACLRCAPVFIGVVLGLVVVGIVICALACGLRLRWPERLRRCTASGDWWHIDGWSTCVSGLLRRRLRLWLGHIRTFPTKGLRGLRILRVSAVLRGGRRHAIPCGIRIGARLLRRHGGAGGALAHIGHRRHGRSRCRASIATRVAAVPTDAAIHGVRPHEPAAPVVDDEVHGQCGKQNRHHVHGTVESKERHDQHARKQDA